MSEERVDRLEVLPDRIDTRLRRLETAFLRIAWPIVFIESKLA